MPIHMEFSTKTIQDIGLGELIKYQTQFGHGLGIVTAVDVSEDKVAVVALRESDGEGSFPQRSQFYLISPVLSYGQDWVLELIDTDETWPGNAKATERTGTITLVRNEKRLRLGSQRNDSKAEWLNIETLKISPPMGYSETIPIVSWRIWSNDDERTRVGAVPIFTFGIKKTASPPAPAPAPAA